jgi:hypothetical protein
MLFVLTPDSAASEGHVSLLDKGNIRLELQFDKALIDAITCLLHLDYDNCVRIINCAMFPSTFNNEHVADNLYANGHAFISKRVSVRHSAAASFTKTIRISYRKYRFIQAKGTHWPTLHLQPRSYSGYFVVSYGLHTLVPIILTFLRIAYSIWEYNTTQLQGLTRTVCGEYCLFAL